MRSRALGVVGKAIPPVDGAAKAKGASRFLQDISVPGMIHAKMVFGGQPHAEIRSLSLEKARRIDGVVAVVTGKDVPGENRVGLVIDDQPLFADQRILYEGDCVAMVGAVSPGVAAYAASQATLTCHRLPPVIGLDEAARLAVEHIVTRGDVNAGRQKSRFVSEQTFWSPVQDHAYMETLGGLALPQADGSIEILAPVQCPFYVRDAVARCLGLPLSKVRVVQLPLGGGFGGKEDVPSEICARLAVLAWKTGRPAKIVLSREEDLLYTSKRHPMQMSYKMGCTGEGKLTFADIEIKADVGAYATLSPIVLFRSTVHACGPYRIPNVSVKTHGFYTNTVPKGAMRGFGTPQVTFACEAVIDELAQLAGMDPLEFRMANALTTGDLTATGQVLEESVGLLDTLAKARESLGQDPAWFRPHPAGRDLVRGKGVATMFYGVSLGAIGRSVDRGAAKVEILKDGSVSVLIGCTDMGQGAVTVISQIAAEALGIGIDKIKVNRVDTHTVADSGPTVASRTTVISGNAVIDACQKLKARMLDVASGILGAGVVYEPIQGRVIHNQSGRGLTIEEIIGECAARRVDLSAAGWYVPPECMVDPDTGQGKAYYVYAFATDVAEVEIDTKTGQIDVRSVYAVHDSGRIVNPLTATSQVEGGIAQGIGLALREHFVQEGGRTASQDLSTYLVPTSLDVCDDMGVEFVESIHEEGPFGAKGLGEPAIIPVPAAIANAVSNALGQRVTSLPILRDWVIRPLR